MYSGNRIKEILEHNDYLYGDNGSWRSYWQDLADFNLPRQAWITTIRVNGQQLKYNFLYDQRAVRAAKKAASHFHSKLTNPASKWFGFETREEKYMQSGAVQRYFKECDDTQYSVMNNSNFSNGMLEYYLGDLVFGTCNMLTEEDTKTHVRYTNVPIEQYQVEEDDRGYVCGVYRNFKFTALQCFMRWGNNCSKDMKEAMTSGKPYQTFDILHYVCERHERDVSKSDRYNMPYSSHWIAKKEKWPLEEGGFHELPYAVARFWKDSLTPFGFSPAMDVLASTKLLNAEKRTSIRAAMKQSDPALMMPSRGWLQPLNLNPAAINYYDASKTNADAIKPIENRGNLQMNVDFMRLEQEEIDNAFFLPFFESISMTKKDMKVLEVQQKIAENMDVVAPVVGRMLDEGLSPIHLRTFGILNRKGLFPPPPKEIQGRDLNIVYLSPLAKSQRAKEIQGLTGWLTLMSELAKQFPDAMDILDVDRIGRTSNEMFGSDPFFLKEQDKVDQIRAKRQELQQRQMQMQTAQIGAQAAQHATQAQKNSKEAAAV